MDITEQRAELERLEKVLIIAKRNGNQLFMENIEREIAAANVVIALHLFRSTSQKRNEPPVSPESPHRSYARTA